MLFFSPQQLDADGGIEQHFKLGITSPFGLRMLKVFGTEQAFLDAVYGINSLGFAQVTLVVRGEFGNSVPVAFCISDCEDSAIHAEFLQSLAEVGGGLLHACDRPLPLYLLVVVGGLLVVRGMPGAFAATPARIPICMPACCLPTHSHLTSTPPPPQTRCLQRLEPKTFLASERTFLAWMHMAVTLGSIAAALLAFAAGSAKSKGHMHVVGAAAAAVAAAAAAAAACPPAPALTGHRRGRRHLPACLSVCLPSCSARWVPRSA